MKAEEIQGNWVVGPWGLEPQISPARRGDLTRQLMVGPNGLEPLTSTVSIYGPHDYGLPLKATKLLFLREITSLLYTPSLLASQDRFRP